MSQLLKLKCITASLANVDQTFVPSVTDGGDICGILQRTHFLDTLKDGEPHGLPLAAGVMSTSRIPI